ncbi:LON peptidase substrate-binding domain-containing protein [Jatrophihabitans sp.]|uniref:LON peptidase substrate-binding domain-containing protein n=1 Tax=Jatrophihabitans sp. TaxID=1932789 RepID=UPI0030C6A635|nr:peptidase [Jatrophihabitans sp.]
MAGVVIPLFPLDHVLMPGIGLPLRIFEPRYRELLADVTGEGGDRRFGVVSVIEGSEVGNVALVGDAPSTATVGTIAEILEVEPFTDGTSAVLTVGSSRFVVEEEADLGKPYLMARVRMLDEPIGVVPPGLAESARASAMAYNQLIARLTRREAEIEPYPRDPVSLSYRLANDAPLPRADRQRLLEIESADERLRSLARILGRELILLRETRSIAVSPAVLREVLGLN